MRKVSEKKVESEFRISIREHRVRALVSTRLGAVEKPDPPAYLPECPGPRLMKAWKRGGLEPRPAYDLTLQYLAGYRGRKGYWRWTIAGAEAGDTLKARSLDPETCAPIR